jgi:hypothetical protein
MSDEPNRDVEPTQKTRPKKGEPVEIPVPTRSGWDKVVKRAGRPVPQDEPNKDQGDPLSGGS